MGKNDEQIEKYYYALNDFRAALEMGYEYGGWKIPLDCAERVVEYVYNGEEIDAKALKAALKKSNSNDLAIEGDKKEDMDPIVCVELKSPGLSEMVRQDFAPGVEAASKYSDCRLGDKFIELCNKYRVSCNAPDKKGAVSFVARQMLEEKMLTNDTDNYIAQGFMRSTVFEIERDKFSLFSAAYRIRNYALQNSLGGGSYAPISDERWREIIRYEFEDELSKLSPAGAKKKEDIYFYTCRRTNIKRFNYSKELLAPFDAFAFLSSNVIYDSALYMVYLLGCEDTSDLRVETIYENLTALVDELKEKEAAKNQR